MPPWLRTVLEHSESLALDNPEDRKTLANRIMMSLIRATRDAGGNSPAVRDLINVLERAA